MRRFQAGVQLLLALALGLSAVAALGMTAPARVARAADIGAPVAADEYGMPKKTFFSATGHHLANEILTAWNTTGGLMTYGYPISEPLLENGRTVQYFERARLEYWPEHAGSQWVVQGTLLGRWATLGREKEQPFRPLPPNTPSDDPANRIIFEETHHSLSHGFKRYWEQNGALYRFGYPISEEFQENGFTVQYFERARFEYHPEHAGTQYEVLLGHLGRQMAESKKINQSRVTQADDAVLYDAGLFDPSFRDALRDISGGWTGYVDTDALGIRSAPDAAATTVDVIYSRFPVVFTGIVRGQPVDGVDAWYVTTDGRYVSARWINPLVPTAPPYIWSGHWVDVNLDDFWLVAYDGNIPVRAFTFVAGVGGSTPTGTFNVQYRVRNETMRSAPGDADYYLVENVEFTQYFAAGGYAIHGNYWTPESAFGGYTSHGCVGLFNWDAEFVWNWIGVGSPVSIHF